jgi:uncharacterized protein (TIGR03435 family)
MPCPGRALVIVVALSVAVAAGQAPSAFDVASVKPTARSDGRALVQAFPGRLVMRNFSGRALILFAYSIADYQLSGGPAWIISDYYDIQATAPNNSTIRQMEGPMLQALLAERFGLTVHREMKQMPVLEMTLASSNLKLRESKDGSCTPYSADSPGQSAPAPGTVFCGFPRTTSNGLNRTLDEAGIQITGLAGFLARWQLHTPIVDKTGLTGTFDIHLEWTDDADTADTSVGTPIFTALREQLGLKLESAKGPVEVLVIDHIGKPSAN